MLVMVVFFIAFRWIHLSTPLIRLFLLVLILLLMPTLNFLPVWFALSPIFVILVVWFLLPRVARLMIHTPTAISIFVCLSMVQLMAVFISMRCTLCGHF